MMRHFKMHSITHVCPIESCKLSFETSVALLQHKRLHDNQCKTCSERFQSLPDLRVHRLKVHNDSDFICSQGSTHYTYSVICYCVFILIHNSTILCFDFRTYMSIIYHLVNTGRILFGLIFL